MSIALENGSDPYLESGMNLAEYMTANGSGPLYTMISGISMILFAMADNKRGYRKNIAGLVGSKGKIYMAKLISTRIFTLLYLVSAYLLNFVCGKIFLGSWLSFGNVLELLRNFFVLCLLLLELLMDTPLYEEQEEYLKVVSSKSRELRQILDKIFELVKLQDANYFLKKEAISINQTLFEEVTAFYHTFEEKKFEVEVDIPPTRFTIYGDEEALHRIFKNLIQNIVVHGEGWASIHLVKLSPHNRRDRMEIRFSNQLENPNAIDMDKLFDRFYRVNSENKADTTGLGLPIVKELVERMNGRIKTDLTEDIFTITLSFECIEMPKKHSQKS